jgi:hypothetical protein
MNQPRVDEKASNMKEKHQRAESVVEAYGVLEQALAGKRRWPKTEFQALFDAVVAYTQSTAEDEMIHRAVASSVSGLREYLEVACKQVPSDALAKADRLETMLFSGYDPYFDGDEPPGL